MLILLPPSEGKFAPRRGKPLSLETLGSPSLTTARLQVLGALMELCKAGHDFASSARLHVAAQRVVWPSCQACSGTLLEHGGRPRTPDELADLLAALGWKVGAHDPTRKGTALDVVVGEL